MTTLVCVFIVCFPFKTVPVMHILWILEEFVLRILKSLQKVSLTTQKYKFGIFIAIINSLIAITIPFLNRKLLTFALTNSILFPKFKQYKKKHFFMLVQASKDCKEMWSNGARKSFDYLTVNKKNSTASYFSHLLSRVSRVMAKWLEIMMDWSGDKLHGEI